MTYEIITEWHCDWQPDDLNPGPDCPYCLGEMCGRFDGLGCTHDIIERHGYVHGYLDSTGSVTPTSEPLPSKENLL